MWVLVAAQSTLYFACPPVCLLLDPPLVSEEIYPNNREGDSGEQKCP